MHDQSNTKLPSLILKALWIGVVCLEILPDPVDSVEIIKWLVSLEKYGTVQVPQQCDLSSLCSQMQQQGPNSLSAPSPFGLNLPRLCPQVPAQM
jgi:hypothetical protein